MADQKILVNITDTEVVALPGSPPVPGSGTGNTLSGSSIAGGVIFTWDGRRDLGASYWYKYKLKVGDGAWDTSWTDFRGTVLFVTRADARWTADGQAWNATVQIKLVSTDGSNTSAEATTSAIGGALDLDTTGDTGDLGQWETSYIADLAITTDKLAADAITSAKIADDQIDSEHIAALAIDTEHIGALQVTGAKIAADAIDGTKIADDSVDSEHYAAQSIDTEHVALLAITNALIDDATIDVAKLAATATANMFSTGGRAKLDAVLYNDANSNVKILGLAADDRILIGVGTNKNLSLNKDAIKSEIDLGNVPNYSQATMLAGITDTILNANTTAILDAEVISRINDQQLTTLIDHLAKASMLRDDGDSFDAFDSSARLLTGIYSTEERTVAAIQASMDVNGNSLLWDPASWKAGADTDDIPAGNIGTANKFVSANEKTGAGYAYTGLHTNGANKIGVYNGASSISASRLYNKNVGGRNVYTKGETFASGTLATDFTPVTMTGDGAVYKLVEMVAFKMVEGDTTIKLNINCICQTAGAAYFRLQTYNSGMVAKTTGTPVVLNDLAYTETEVEVAVHVDFSEGDLIYVAIEGFEANTKTISYRGWSIDVFDS